MNDQPALSDLDLNLLRVFEAVFRAQNITLAARELRLTQPAVSNALARLRAHLADPLFVRDGRVMAPTPRARALATPIGEALALVRGALGKERESFHAEASDRTFYVGMREVTESLVLGAMVRELARAAPRVSVASVRFERPLLPRTLASRALDFAIDVRLPRSAGLMREPLVTEPLCVAMRSGHPLARRRLDIAAWLGATHVAVSARREGLALEDVLLARFAPSHGPRRVGVRCQTHLAACSVLTETDHLLVLPRRYAERMRRFLPLVLRDPPLPLPGLELYVYWHASAERDPGLRWLLDLLHAVRDRPDSNTPR